MKTQRELLTTFKCAAMPALFATALLCATPAATAGGQVPFKAVFNTEAESTVNFPIASVHVVGEGHATHLGRSVTETTDQLVNLLTGAGTATYKFVGADGSALNVSFAFQAIPLPSQPGFSLPGNWTVVGGTGRFAGASGSGTADGTVIFTSETTGLGHFTMNGTISSPGSLK
jgi:hypothetical protein